jgi:hypothetical protein
MRGAVLVVQQQPQLEARVRDRQLDVVPGQRERGRHLAAFPLVVVDVGHTPHLVEVAERVRLAGVPDQLVRRPGLLDQLHRHAMGLKMGAERVEVRGLGSVRTDHHEHRAPLGTSSPAAAGRGLTPDHRTSSSSADSMERTMESSKTTGTAP